jgi:hypothetical protein
MNTSPNSFPLPLLADFVSLLFRSHSHGHTHAYKHIQKQNRAAPAFNGAIKELIEKKVFGSSHAALTAWHTYVCRRGSLNAINARRVFGGFFLVFGCNSQNAFHRTVLRINS